MTGRGLLLSELGWIVGNVCRLLELIKEEHHDWRPQDNMRTLIELANHLAQIPSVDLRIIKGDTEGDIESQERDLNSSEPEKLCALLKEGSEDMTRFMENLSFDDYENGSATAFFGRTQVHAQWLMECVTHLYHHRAMLFLYMKQIGYEIGTRELYS